MAAFYRILLVNLMFSKAYHIRYQTKENFGQIIFIKRTGSEKWTEYKILGKMNNGSISCDHTRQIEKLQKSIV